jgi:putative hemolysin
VLEFLVIVICLGLNAILSCVEMAFVAGRGDKLAQRLLDLRVNPERVLSVLQIGITLVGAISAAVGGASAEESLGPPIQRLLNVTTETSESISIVLIVIPLTYFSVVIGELVPKTLALRSPLKFAKFGALFLVPLDKVFSPIVYLLEVSTKFILRPFLKNFEKEVVLDPTANIDLEPLSDSHKQYVFNLLSVDGRKAKDIMVPWKTVTKININSNVTTVLDLLRDSRYARLPVVRDETPIGILNFKEFFCEPEVGKLDWTQLLKPVFYINSEEPILNILKQMQNKNIHLAIIKKAQEPIGIVTLEDIFEEIVGDIYDEDDRTDILISTNSKIRNMGILKN